MTNQQFLADCKQKLQGIHKQLRDGEQLQNSDTRSLREQANLLESAIKIMTYGTGPQRRKFRRDYERRIAQ